MCRRPVRGGMCGRNPRSTARCSLTRAFFLFCSYYVEEFSEDEGDGDLAELLSDLLAPDGILAAQVGDVPTLETAALGNPDMQGRFDFIEDLESNGFVRIVDYEEVRIVYGFRGPVRHRTKHATGRRCLFGIESTIGALAF